MQIKMGSYYEKCDQLMRLRLLQTPVAPAVHHVSHRSRHDNFPIGEQISFARVTKIMAQPGCASISDVCIWSEHLFNNITHKQD